MNRGTNRGRMSPPRSGCKPSKGPPSGPPREIFRWHGFRLQATERQRPIALNIGRSAPAGPAKGPDEAMSDPANSPNPMSLPFVEALYADFLRDPNSVPALEGLATAYHYVAGRTGDALAQWRKVLRLQPGYVPVLVQASWVLATTKDAALRNGAEAAVLADRAVRATGGKDPAALDALAAALAETGRFAEAVSAAERARAAAQAQGNPGLAAEVDARLALYRARKPYREGA